MPNEGLNYVMNRQLKDIVVIFGLRDATTLLEQFQETTQQRSWLLIAVGIMRTHLHAIVGVPDDPDPDKILGDLKVYGSRCLNKLSGRRDDWWTRGGSKRKLSSESAVEAGVQYIRDQSNPLLIWTRVDGLLVPRVEMSPD